MMALEHTLFSSHILNCDAFSSPPYSEGQHSVSLQGLINSYLPAQTKKIRMKENMADQKASY